MQVRGSLRGWLISRARTLLAALLVLGAMLVVGLAGPIGGYVEAVLSVAFDVESSGRVHVVWTGKLNPDFDGEFTYYSTSVDGVNWTPYQILDYYAVNQPQVVVDDARQLAHLVYRGYDGIMHRTASNGTVSAPRVVGWGTTIGTPSLAADPTSGKAFVSWRESYMAQKSQDTWHGMYRSWYSVWDGTSWAIPWRVIHDEDTNNTLLAAAPGAKVMLAWFQQWSVTAGNGATAGGPAVLRTAYSTDGSSFALRQQANPGTGTIPKDDSFLLASSSDGKFYLLAKQLKWPGHSISHRYVWSGGAWSAPLQVSHNASDWGVPVYVGTAAGTTYYVYQVAGVQWLRTETTPGVLSAQTNFTDTVAATGLSGDSAKQVSADGKFHFVGPVTGQAGIYYAHQ